MLNFKTPGLKELLEEVLKRGNKQKIGIPWYRTLWIDDSPESKEAIEFMEKTNLAYMIEYMGGFDTSTLKLPTLFLPNGLIIRGLEAIKHHDWFGPFPKEREYQEK